MLYCVLVSSSGRHTNEVHVDPGHHQVWEARDEAHLETMIWEERCEVVEPMEGLWVCDDCGYDYIEEGDCCDSCGCTEEDWDEHVEGHSHAEFVEYEPMNPQHALCTNYRCEVERPEHAIAVAARKAERHAHRVELARRKVARIEEEFDRALEELNGLLS